MQNSDRNANSNDDERDDDLEYKGGEKADDKKKGYVFWYPPKCFFFPAKNNFVSPQNFFSPLKIFFFPSK